MADMQKKLQELSEGYQALQGGECPPRCKYCPPLTPNIELSTAVEARQRLESQQQENTTVKKVR